MIFELPVSVSEDTTIIETYRVVLEDNNVSAKLYKIEKHVVEESEEIIETYAMTFYKHPLSLDNNGQKYQWINEQEVVNWMMGLGYSEKESE
jgi:regulator of RNase E activity RraB